MPKCGTKNALFEYLRPKLSYLDIFWLEFEKNVVKFEISVFDFALLQSLM